MQDQLTRRPSGMTAFWIVWAGQLVSLLGSAATQFGITIWMFERTGSATALAATIALYSTPLVLMLPVVGMMVDRYNRKLMMMLSDLAAGMVTVGFLTLYATGQLQIWHIYVGTVINGIFSGFQWPAYSAALSVMIPKAQYVRANSMLEVVGPGSNIAGPILAGTIFGLGKARGFDGLTAIMLLDIVTFGAAIGSLLLARIPNPQRTEAGRKAAEGNIFQEAIFGFKYIFQQPPLLKYLIFFLALNFFLDIGINPLRTPMLLARTDSNAWIFASAQTIGAAGFVVGGLIVGGWGGFKRRIRGVIWGSTGYLFFSSLLFGLGRPEPAWMLGLWAAGIFTGGMFFPLITGSSHAIWMSKVPPDVQGKVFSARRFFSWVTTSTVPLIAGPLADFVVEPAMREGGSLAPVFGWLVGTGPGTGMALLIVFAGIGGVLFSLAMYLVPSVRNIEDLLPDHDTEVTGEPSAAPSEAVPARAAAETA
jgi:DHA3 family macrolide efflux protein-like MFS transporter